MTERQKAFCEYYSKNPNATAAAVQAGYSNRTAYSIGQRLLSNPEVAGYLRQLQEASRSSRIADSVEIKTALTDIMRDSENRNSDRVAAAKVLLRASGETLPERRVDDDEQITIEPIDHICLPVLDGGTDANALETPGHDVIPFPGHEHDELLFYIPFNLEAIEDYLTAAAQRAPEAEKESEGYTDVEKT